MTRALIYWATLPYWARVAIRIVAILTAGLIARAIT